MSAKKDMLSRLSNVAKNAPLQESAGTKTEEVATAEQVPSAEQVVTPIESVKKVKPARRAKNLQIPEDLWDAYEVLKNNNTTSLLMTGYILEAFREKLAKDGAFNKS